MARTIAVANQKGGVGKTTTAVNLAAALSLGGAQVLLVDCDPQGNASTGVGLPHSGEVTGTYEVLVDETPIGEVVRAVPELPNLQAVVATPDLAGAQVELVSQVAREFRLRRALEAHLARTAVDYVILDCPPGLDLLTVNALVAADEVLVPMQCEYYSLEGLSQLEGTIGQVRDYLNPGLRSGPILLTMYEARSELSAEVLADVRSHFPDRVMQTVIPRSPEVSVAPSHGKPVVTFRPDSRGGQAYLVAAFELAERFIPPAPARASVAVDRRPEAAKQSLPAESVAPADQITA